MKNRNIYILVVAVVVVVIAVGIGISTLGEKEEKEPIVIGHLYDSTGVLAPWGKGYHKATKGAIEYINEELGGIDGRPVEYIWEDTESKSDVAVEKMRRLVDRGADFIIGSQSSAACLATNPLAERLNVVTFQIGHSDKVAEEGNRYMFLTFPPVSPQSKVMGEYAVNELGVKKWSVLAYDYAWGHLHKQAFTETVREEGGEILKTIDVPLGVSDVSKYVSKIPPETEGIGFYVYGGPAFDGLDLIRSSFPEAPVMGQSAFDAIKIEDVGSFANGWVDCNTHMAKLMEDVPPEYKDMVEEYRQWIGINDRGRDSETGEEVAYTLSHMAWSSVFLIKDAVEGTNWESRDDNPELINFLEGYRAERSIKHPQGDLWIRTEDHIVWRPTGMLRIENLKLRLVERYSFEESIIPPLANFGGEE